MPSTTENINRNRTTVERAIPMVTFSISEDEDDAPLVKRPRCSEPPSQSRVTADEDVEEDELIPVEDYESDSQGVEEEEDHDGDEFEAAEDDDVEIEDDADDYGEADPVPQFAVAHSSSPIASPVFNNANGELQAVFTDPDVLDCPICLDPLCTPVFQCENGHIACSSCCSKVKRKCPSCCMPIGYNRCRAIEKVIESVKISCKNARYGCKKTMTYNKKNEHEQMCPYAICFCPHPSCPFVDSSKNLYLHFGIQHAASTTRFTYNTTFTLHVELNQKHMLLQEQQESVIFILNHEVKEHGRAFNVDCVGPSTLKTSFVYQLTAKSMEATLSLQCVPEMYAKWSEHMLKKNYLTVLSDFSRYNGVVPLDVCIKKAISPV